MEKEKIHAILQKQKGYFLSGETLKKENRINNLKKLYNAILNNQQALKEALYLDLGKSEMESDMCEIRLTLSEISYMIKHTPSFMKKKRVKTDIANAVASSYVLSSPRGNTLIMSPWNYPVLLSLEPLADSLAAGNTAIIKPSAYSKNVSSLLNKIISETFPEELVCVIEGGREENSALLDEEFDYIFFTGSGNVGRLVMEKASKHLTPVTLELGGKSPCIITKNANIKIAARRFVFGKLINCGQTCVAPDYLLVDSTIKEEFINEVKKEIEKQYGSDVLKNKDYGKIINDKHFERILSLIDKDKVIYGGRSNKETRQIEPTILDSVTLSDRVMQEEIFGPLIPIISYHSLNEAISIIRSLPHPLAFYVFTEDKKEANALIASIGFGGGCINDCLIHLATSRMGFGGFRESGMGSYHGKSGYDTFSHKKSIVDKKTFIDIPIRYQPYNDKKHRFIRMFLK